jgi:putative hydrolase of the HAD superfamily
MSHKPKLIIIDFSDVLVKGLEGIEVHLSKKFNTPIDIVANSLYKHNFHEFYTGKMTENTCLKLLIESSKWNISLKELKQVIRANFYEIKGTKEIIKEISKKYKTVMLSVNSREWVSFLKKQYNFEDLFTDGIYYSYEIGYTKWQKESYEYVLQTHNLLPQDVLFIDDGEKNIKLAKELGIPSIRFLSPSQLESDLKKLHIL